MDAERTSGGGGYVVECFWPGVTQGAYEDADRRVRTASEQLEPEAGPLLYLGSLLMPEDEMLFFQFEAADADGCRTVLVRAGIDHERVLQAVGVRHSRRRLQRKTA